MKKRKLLFVINELSFFISHRWSLAKAAQGAGYEIHVAAPEGRAISELTQQGFFFHPLPMNRKGLTPLRDIRSLYYLCHLYRRLRPDIVHHLTMKPILYGGLAARLTHIPAVVHAVTGLGYIFTAQTFRVCFLRQCIKCGLSIVFRHPHLRVIFQNSEDHKEFEQLGLIKSASGLLIKGSGVPLDCFHALPELKEDIPVVLLPARLLWDKGVGEFVRAAEILQTKMKVRMAIAGAIDPGNPRTISQEQLDCWIDSGVVEYWGFQKNIQQAFRRCHIVCLPSYYREGVPRVLIEAAACSRAIVTTDMPGCRDIVRDRKNGLLVAAKNPEALARAIAILISNADLRQRMGQRGRELVEAEFSASLVNKKTLAVYERLYL